MPDPELNLRKTGAFVYCNSYLKGGPRMVFDRMMNDYMEKCRENIGNDAETRCTIEAFENMALGFMEQPHSATIMKRLITFQKN